MSGLPWTGPARSAGKQIELSDFFLPEFFMSLSSHRLTRRGYDNDRSALRDEIGRDMTKTTLIACVTALLAGMSLLGTAAPASAGNCYQKVGNKVVACKHPQSSMVCRDNRCKLTRPLSAAAKARAAYRAKYGRH